MKVYLQLIILLFLSKIAHAATVYVDVDGSNPTPPYSSWNTASTTIQDALFSATSGDNILVTNGNYRITSEIQVNTSDVTIQSVNGPDVTVVDAQTYSRVFNISVPAAVLNGFTITGGFAGSGGGICPSRHSSTIRGWG